MHWKSSKAQLEDGKDDILRMWVLPCCGMWASVYLRDKKKGMRGKAETGYSVEVLLTGEQCHCMFGKGPEMSCIQYVYYLHKRI